MSWFDQINYIGEHYLSWDLLIAPALTIEWEEHLKYNHIMIQVNESNSIFCITRIDRPILHVCTHNAIVNVK